MMPVPSPPKNTDPNDPFSGIEPAAAQSFGGAAPLYGYLALPAPDYSGRANMTAANTMMGRDIPNSYPAYSAPPPSYPAAPSMMLKEASPEKIQPMSSYQTVSTLDEHEIKELLRELQTLNNEKANVKSSIANHKAVLKREEEILNQYINALKEMATEFSELAKSSSTAASTKTQRSVPATSYPNYAPKDSYQSRASTKTGGTSYAENGGSAFNWDMNNNGTSASAFPRSKVDEQGFDFS